MKIRGALRRRRKSVVLGTEKAETEYMKMERSIQEMSEHIRRERERLVKIDPIYKFLFLDRTAIDFDEQVQGVIKEHKLFMETEFAKKNKES
jgi:hypothetical protein